MIGRKALLLAVSSGALALGATTTAQAASSVLNSAASRSGGELVFQLTNFDDGAVYPDLSTDGGSAPFEAGAPGATNQAEVNAGITALNGLQTADATGAYNPDTGEEGDTSGLGTEDTWGVFRINNLQDRDGNILWATGDQGQELTAIFYGERDHYVKQNTNGTQTIEGTGLHVDIYQDGSQNYDPTQGSSGRTSEDTYNTATDGTDVLNLVAEGGHLNQDGENGGAASSFRSFFDPLTGASQISAKGLSFLSVVGGESASLFDTNQFGVSDANAALGYSPADLKTEFSINNTDVADWLVRSNDPVTAFPVPTPAAAFLGLAMLGGLGLRRKHRRAW